MHEQQTVVGVDQPRVASETPFPDRPLRCALSPHLPVVLVLLCANVMCLCVHTTHQQVDDPEQRRTVRQKRFNGYGDNFGIKRAGVPDLSTLPSERGVGASTSSAKASKAAKQ